MGPLRVSNVLQPDNRIAAGPWVGWAHGGVCSVCGRAQWPWRVLRTAGGCGVRGYFWARVRWVSGLLGGASFARRSGPISGCGWGLAAWRVFCARLRGFLFVMRWIVPLCLILTAFSPLPRSVPKPCAETSYLRVQCLCLATLGYAILCAGRRGYTILDVFG